MTIRFLEEAQREFLEAISGYEEARGGLGRRFKDEVERCISRVAEQPELYRLRSGVFRRSNLHIFPYYIPYVVREEVLWVLAVAHASRKPQYWITRRHGVL